MPDFDIGGLGEASGSASGYTNAAHVDHLLAFVKPVTETRKGQHGDYDVAMCDYVVCTTCHHAWADVPVSGAWLVPRLVSSEHEIVPCKLTLGEKVGDKNAPFVPEEATDDERGAIDAIFQKFAIKMPTGKIVFDTDAYHEEPF